MEKYPKYRTFRGTPIPLLFGGLFASSVAALLAGVGLLVLASFILVILALQVVDFAGKVHADLTSPALRDPRYSDFEIPNRVYPVLYGFEIVWQFGLYYQQFTAGRFRNCVYRLDYFPEIDGG